MNTITASAQRKVAVFRKRVVTELTRAEILSRRLQLQRRDPEVGEGLKKQPERTDSIRDLAAHV
jgi:hypothetical protein